MKGKLKANTVDRYLHPIRNQIVELVQPNVSVIEYGCGNGDLLIRLSDKIKAGVGLDSSPSLISYANRRKEKEDKKNIVFKLQDLTNRVPDQSADYAIASLFFHVLPLNQSIKLIKRIIHLSETTIVCGFSRPENRRQDLLLWMDQRFSGHYSHYKQYRKTNFTEGLLSTVNGIDYHCYDTFDPVIKIYKITKS